MKKHRNAFLIGKKAQIRKVGRRGYDKYLKRLPSAQEQKRIELIEKIQVIHKAKRKI
jgi:hypothetical protein